MVSYQPDEQTAADLATARRLAELGIPVFIAQPDSSNKTGYVPPAGWQDTIPDPSVVDRWQPGLALCAVMGHGFDLVDLDPRNGAAWPEDVAVPRRYAIASTPSGGLHFYISSLGVGSRDNIFPGIDVKGGRPDGTGRGFAFLAPTVRASSVDGELRAYRWVQSPELESLVAGGDESGVMLAERISAVLGQGVSAKGGPDWWRDFLLSRDPQSKPAADRAIDDKLAEVGSWSPSVGSGFRGVLMRAAMTLGGYVGGGYLDEADAVARLEATVARVWGEPNDDDRRWIEQGIADGQLLPFHVYTAADLLAMGFTDAEREPDAPPPWTVYNAIGIEPFDPGPGTDQDMAEAVVERMYPAMRYASDAGCWLVRKRDVWTEYEDVSGWAVSTVARLMPLGDPNLPAKTEDYLPEHWQARRRKDFMSSAGSAKIERKLKTVVRVAGHPGSVEMGRLDSHPEVLWAGGVAWNLRESRYEPVPAALDPSMPHLHTALVAPKVCETPYWDAFLAAIWPDPAVRAWALRVLSISLAGYADAALPVLFGPERTGKTALISLLMDVLGTYGHAADPRLLSAGDNVHASVIYALKGRRLSFIDEGPRKGHLASERLKQLTGGGVLTGNAMRSNPISFKPTHTLVMTTNDEPPVQDPALRARMRIIPCEGTQIGVKRARKAITDEVWGREAPGVLAQLMAECAGWLADQDSALMSAAPASVLGEADEIAGRQNVVAEWVEMCTVPADPGTAASELYESFCRWFREQARHGRTSPPTLTAFGRTLTDLGHVVRKNQGPKRNQNYRPLTVIGGSIITTPWEPRVAEAYLSDADTGKTEPSGACSPRSQPVFSVFSDSTDSTHNIYKGGEVNTHNIETTALIRSVGQDVGKKGLTKPADQAKAGAPRPSTDALGTRQSDENLVLATGLSRESAQVAARSAREGITKAEARAQLKGEARQAAIRDASGEYVGLPAVVDRAGNVLSINTEQAGSILDACLGRTGGALTVDVETSGYPVGHVHHKLRSVQLGDEVAAVVLDPDAHAEVIRAYLDAATTLHAHSASADIVPIAHHGLGDADQLWTKMIDTVIPAKLADPASTGSDPGLKKLAEAVLGPEATAPGADEGRERVFKAGKWLTRGKPDTEPQRLGWAQIDTGCEAMLRYAASDVLDTAALARRLPPVAPAVLGRERIAEEMAARITSRGLRISRERVAELTEYHLGEQAKAAAKITAFGIENPGSTKQVSEKLLSMGAQLPVSEKGNPSVAEHVLALLKDAQGDCGVLATALLEYRHSTTALGLFLEPYRLICELGDGRARPTIYTLGTDTGRMCLPTTHRLVTRTGFVKPDELTVGMETLDAAGDWVRVMAVHRYDDQPLTTITNRGLELASTPEHRWVTTRDHEAEYARRVGRPAPARQLRKLDDHPRLRVHLAPEVEPPFDFTSRTIPAETDGQRFAALIGMLVTDGRCAEGGTGAGLRAYVYQTEAKFYVDFLRVIPVEALMYDRVTNGLDHHELRIKARWLRPQLEAAGLRPGELLKESADLHRWVAELPLDELRAFFAACWLADGSLAGKMISCGSANLREVLALAAYRLGVVAYTVNTGQGGWSTKDRLILRFRQPVVTVRKSVFGESRSDVWCVTTETGTFTAVSPQGAVYLTGNSSVRPNFQQLPRSGGVRSVVVADEGMCFISADFSGVELRGAAALSQDPQMMHAIREEDAGRFDGFHWQVARAAFGPQATKEHRYIAKRGCFGTFYGGGAAGLAKQVGVPESEMRIIIDSLKSVAPTFFVWADQMRSAVRQGRTQFPTYSGRIIHMPAATPHKAPAYAIQGTCRELLVDGFIRFRETQWGDATILPVHDEIIAMVPIEDAVPATEALVECMRSQLYGVEIIADPGPREEWGSVFWRDST